MTELLPHPNRLRDHTASDFVDAYNNAETHDEQVEIRKKLKQLDGGRWYDVLDEAHKHFAAADLDGRRYLVGMYSDSFLQWIGVLGLVEDLNTFEDVTGVTRE